MQIARPYQEYFTRIQSEETVIMKYYVTNISHIDA